MVASVRLTICACGVMGGHNQSECFVCLSVIRGACDSADNLADEVDRLLIYCMDPDLDTFG